MITVKDRRTLPLLADDGLGSYCMNIFLRSRICVIQRSNPGCPGDLTEYCMSSLANSSSDGKADDAMHTASGSSPRTTSLVSLSRSISLSCAPFAPSTSPVRVDLAVPFLRSRDISSS